MKFKYFLIIGVVSIIAIALGLFLGDQEGSLEGQPENMLFFGGVIVGCLNAFLGLFVKG